MVFLQCYGEIVFQPHFLEIVVEVKATGMVPVKYSCHNKASFYVSQILRRSLDEDEVKSGHPSFWDIIGFKTVVSVCLSV